MQRMPSVFVQWYCLVLWWWQHWWWDRIRWKICETESRWLGVCGRRYVGWWFCNEIDASDSCFVGNDKSKCGKVKSSTHTRRRWQNILTKLRGVIGKARNGTIPFEAWSSLITNEILDNILLPTNQYILNIQPNFVHESDAKLTDKTETNAFIGLLCLTGELLINKQSVEEMWGTNGDGTENFRVIMNYRRLKFLVRCILE